MSDIDISLKLSDGGSIKSTNKDAERLNTTLDQTERLTHKINKARQATYKATQADQQGEGQSYGVARSAAGTGAAGRDFAKQAQGLGGLVHVYATFAANLFAVGAAFRALSEAADTTNMIKGMDQLGAAQGRSLGTIAKRMVEVTDGAVSFREAIEATTKGSAAGLSSAQLGQMAEVAKKASQSLGISMPDALSRLSRGISKIEPELLDELGIYTKIEKATTDYARTIGKTASSLTDFERRQAFANAVLNEGADKFSAIDMAANPYDKLLASLKNTGQQALEVVNVALTPLVSLLAASPTGLMATLGGIAVMLLKQAIPALGHYRESLKATAEESRLTFVKIYKDQQSALEDTMLRSAQGAEAAYRNSAAVAKKTKELSMGAEQFKKTSKMDWASLAAKDPFAMTDKEIKSLENRAKTLSKSNAAEAEAMRAHIKDIKRLRLEASTAGDIAQNRAESSATGPLTTVGANEIIYRRQMTSAVADNIKSTVAETQAVYGARAAFSKLGEQLALAKAGMLQVQVGTDAAGNAIMEAAPRMGKLKAATTGLSASFGIVTSKIATTVSALSPWLVGIGIALELLSLFDGWMSKTARAQDDFSKSLQATDDSIANVTRTVDLLNKKGITQAATISGVFALSNAMSELTNATEIEIAAQLRLKKELEGSWYDNAKNNIASLFGGGADNKLASSLTTTLQSSLEIFKKSGQYKEAADAFKEALGIDSLDTKTLVQGFKNGTISVDEFEKVLKRLNGGLAANNARLQTFKTASETSTKAYQEFIQSTANSNPLFKLGAALDDVAFAMTDVLAGGMKDVNAAFDDLTKNPEKFTLFGKTFVEQFVNIRKEFKETFEAEQKYMQQVSEIDAKMAEKQQRVEEAKALPSRKGGKNERFLRQAGADLESLQAEKDKLNAPNLAVYQKVTDIFNEGATNAFKEGSRLIEVALGQAAQKAALSIAQAKLGGLTGEQAALEANRLKQQELGIQLNAINTNIDLIRSQEDLKATIDLSNAIATAADKTGKSSQQIQMDQANLIAASAYKGILSAKGKLEPITTGNETANNLLKLKLAGPQRAEAAQEANRTIIGGQIAAAKIEGARALRAGQVQDLEKINQLTSDISQQEINRLNTYQGIVGATTTETQQRIISLENETLESKQAAERRVLEDSIQNARDAGNQKQIDKQTAALKLVTERQLAEKDNKGLQDRNKLIDITLANETKIRELKFNVKDQVLKGIADENAANQENLTLRSSLFMITAEEAEKEKNSLATQALQNDLLRQELKLQHDKKTILDEIQAKIDKSAGGDPAAIAQLKEEKTLKEQDLEQQERNYSRMKELKLKNLELDQSMGEKFKGYSSIVEKGFQDMGDALVDFAKTGKLNFKGLIDQMLTDLIRFEMRAQMSAMYSSMGGLRGIGSFFGMGGTGTTVGGPMTGGGETMVATPLPALAKGGAYDVGIKAFAKGGTFTNSLVTSPTLFKFAHGTGLMGEAGPEAIMPLKRDASGNLGVRAGNQGNTSVVVNNYGNEKATTTETVDSRGNRKIEVMIGDAVASELGRSGSSTQQAMRSNYGSTPMVARR